MITFNYTNTYELLAKSTDTVYHIHGRVKEGIVLGVNSDESDEILGLDTSFIRFKSIINVYKQTDVDYLQVKRLLQANRNARNYTFLHVIGHSLDITDADIVRDIFDLFATVTIYYYKESAIGDYVKNLISIFGRSKFDEIRERKKLKFVPYGLEWEELKNGDNE